MKYNTILKVFIFLLFSLTVSIAQTGNEKSVNAIQEFQRLLDKGTAFSNKKDYQKALESYVKAEVFAEKNQLPEQLFTAKQSIGNIYDALSNFSEALNYFTQAYKIAVKNPKSQQSVAMVLNSVGILYHKEENYKEALIYYKRAYEIASKGNFKYEKAHFAINMAAVSNELGYYKEAIDYLEDVKNEPKTKEIEEAWRICYAESLILAGQLERAKPILDKLSVEIRDRKDYRNNVDIAILQARLYGKKNQIAQGIKAAKQGLKISKRIGLLHWNIPLFKELSDLYLKKGDYITGRKYVDSIFETKDSISKLVKQQLFESNKIKFNVQEYQYELKINKEKYESERKLFIAGIVFSLLLFFFIYRGLKNRIIKQKQEKIIGENQQKIIGLEMEGLKNNIAEKNRKLSAKALYLSGRNELIEEVINSLAKIPEVFDNKEVANYIKTLKEYLKTDAEWDDFIAYFEQVNHDFFRALKTRHPQLVPQDIRFLCYIYMNLDIKEISTIFSITAEAGRKRKQRIAKKMDIDIDDLHEYILKIH